MTTATAEARFWSKVDRSGECWLWTGYVDESGYGQLYLADNKKVKPHRFAYELLVGPIPEGHELDHRHTCPKRCVYPVHLRPTTHKQNHENRAGPNANTTSGVRGVTWDKNRKRWLVQAMHHGHNYNGGRFIELADAEAAAIALRLRLHTHSDIDMERAS